jgi:hypothetical protein
MITIGIEIHLTFHYIFPTGNTLMIQHSSSETIPRNGTSHIQSGANELEMWNLQNKFQLNVQKCKELLFQFHRNRVSFDNIHLLAGCPNLVRQAKILGVTVSDDLRWSIRMS